MSENTWKKLSWIGIIIGLLDILVLILLYNDRPNEIFKENLGLLLISLVFIIAAFGIFDRVRDQITKGVNWKTFLYTALIMGAMYLFATYVVV